MVKFPTKFDEFLPPAAMSRVFELLSQPALASTVRDALQKVGLKDANPVAQMQDAWRQARGWVESVVDRVMEQTEASPVVVNATGQLFDPRWTGLPADSVVVQAMAAAAITFQDQALLEQYAERLAIEATGASAAVLGCNVSAVCGALIQADAIHGSFVIARTDILRIPGSTDLRALLAKSPHRLIEVGAGNGVTPEEWRQVLSAGKLNLLLVSPNNLDSVDAAAQRTSAIQAARASGCRVIEILFDATLDPVLAGRFQFPLVRSSIESGADLVIAPLNNLIGGPVGAVAVGRNDLVQTLRAVLHDRGLQLIGASLAGAAAAFRLSQGTSKTTTTVGQLLLISPDNLKERARRIALQLNNSRRVETAEGVPTESRLGPSPWNRYRCASFGVALTPRDVTAEALQEQLASGKFGTTIWGRIDAGRLLLDLRLIDPADDHILVSTLTDDDASTVQSDAPLQAASTPPTTTEGEASVS